MNKNAKILFALLLVFLMIFSVVSCSAKQQTGNGTNSENTADSSTAGTNADGSRLWILATALDWVSDIQYTLRIREGVTFSNGNPLTAEDVLFTMELCAAHPQAFLNVKAVDFEKTKVVDEYTIDLWYTEYNAAQEPGLSQMMIMDKESYDEAELARNPIGTGAYTVTDYVVNSHVFVDAREDYWGETPKIKKVNFYVANEDAQRINAIETGDVDMASIPLKDAEFAEAQGYVVTSVSAGVAITANFNMTPDGVLGTKEARYAVSHAIDRQSIADIVYAGKAKVLSWPISESAVDFEPRFANAHETYSVGYDPEIAKEYAEKSGLIGQTVRIITNGAPDNSTIAELIQSNLLDIGVDAKITNYDQATYFGILMDESQYDIALFNPSAPSIMAVDILSMYPTFITQGWSGPERDEFGTVSQRAITTYDAKARGDLINEFLRIFLEADLWYGLCEGVSIRAYSADLRGVEFTLAGGIYYQNVYFA